MKYAAALCFLLGLIPSLLSAQDSTLDEAEFWALLNQTDSLLVQALAQPDPTPTKAQILQLWQNVRQVRLRDTIIDVNVGWITEPLVAGDTESLRTLQQQVHALLSDHMRRIPGEDSGASLSALDDVLQDSRFQYAEITPTPVPTRMPDTDSEPATNAISPGLSQILLMAVGVIAAVAVFLYFARSLRIQPASLDKAASADEPTSSGSAADLAARLASDHDYRSAIRYLYLSSLLLLDERGIIHYDSTLTNREHLRQLRERPQIHDVVRRIVNVFEDVWYGYAPVDETFYQQYVEQIHQLWQFVP